MSNDPRIDPKRSALMKKVRQKNTSPEIAVRKLLHRLGYRFRLHRRNLPGQPDIVLPGRKKAIFVHGCFWHQHPNCARATIPKTRTDFWKKKFEKNEERDRRKIVDLRRLDWRVLVVWECETRNEREIERTLSSFLET
jgi:DNA mismatch endonuclease (patch repair protein)